MNSQQAKLVSIIIPTYNRQSWIKEALESVLCQSYSHYELIVVDDGSCDNTSNFLRSLDTPARYFFQSNQGPSAARNKGLDLSRGEWIAFLDSDDLWKPEKLKKQMEVLQKEPRFKVCYTDEIWIRNGQFVNPRKRHAKVSGWIYPHCLPLCIISPSSVIIHRSVFEEVGRFDTKLPVAEDYDLWLRISSHYEIKLLSQKLVVKRGGHLDQLSKRYWGIDRFRIRALEKMATQSHLPISWRITTLKELAKKASVVAQGSKKRKKWQDYHFYQIKARRAHQQVSYLLSHYNYERQAVKE